MRAILGRGKATNDGFSHGLVLKLRREVFHHIGEDHARRDHVHIDVEDPQLPGQRLGHGDFPALGSGVVRLSEFSAQAVDRGDVDDLAVFLILEDHRCGLVVVEIALEVDPDDRIPLLLGHLPDHAVPGNPGVADEDV